ncbi:hypothetical protein ACFE04_000819 [Oxalis oulophora]
MEGEIVNSVSSKRINWIDISDSGSSSHASPMPKRARLVDPRGPFNLKGIVPQSNGNWGAQIYANNERTWLGTFKTDREAAIAYYRAALKLRNVESSVTSIPWANHFIKERDFQSCHSTKAVLDMIRDGSYETKYVQFVLYYSRGMGTTASPDTPMGMRFRVLFQKDLTPSDVGKLNRIVIPKKHAVKCLPKITEEVNGIFGATNDLELEFYDRSMKSWKFRYCYWNSSQTFVFTKGWSRFVKEKRLRENDTVLFYLCQSREGPSSRAFYLIDAKVAESSDNQGEILSVASGGQAVSIEEIDLDLRLGLRTYDNMPNLDAEEADAVASADAEEVDAVASTDAEESDAVASADAEEVDAVASTDAEEANILSVASGGQAVSMEEIYLDLHLGVGTYDNIPNLDVEEADAVASADTEEVDAVASTDAEEANAVASADVEEELSGVEEELSDVANGEGGVVIFGTLLLPK